jgi:hypothetical protein
MTEPRRLSDNDGPAALLLSSAHDDGPSAASFERTAKRLGLAGAAFGAATLATSSGAAGTAATAAKGAGALGAGAGAGLASTSGGTGLASSGAGLAGATKVAGAAGISLFAKIAGIAAVGVALTAGTVVATREAPKSEPVSATAASTVAAPPAKKAVDAPVTHPTPATEAQASAEAVVATAPPLAIAEPVVEPSNAKAKGSVKAAAGADDDHALRDEVALLDQARAAISSGNTGAALSALDRHKREFPRGFLSSEAEVLRVEALVKAGRTAEAREQGERLLSREPNGPQAKRVRSLLGM